MTATRRQTVTLLSSLLLMAGLLASSAFAAGTLEPYEGDNPTPAFSLPDLKGTTRTLTDYRGKVVVVNFWASWCPPCIKEMPGMQRLQEKMVDQPFVFLPINVAEQKYRVWKFVKLINFTLPVLLDTDSKTFAGWNASVLPTSFLLDTDGQIRYRVQGDLEWDSEEVISLVEELMSEKQENKQ